MKDISTSANWRICLRKLQPFCAKQSKTLSKHEERKKLKCSAQKQVFQTGREAVCPANESRAGEIAEAKIITSAESQRGRQRDSAAQHKHHRSSSGQHKWTVYFQFIHQVPSNPRVFG